jgi:hypothetical protein
MKEESKEARKKEEKARQQIFHIPIDCRKRDEDRQTVVLYWK